MAFLENLNFTELLTDQIICDETLLKPLKIGQNIREIRIRSFGIVCWIWWMWKISKKYFVKPLNKKNFKKEFTPFSTIKQLSVVRDEYELKFFLKQSCLKLTAIDYMFRLFRRTDVIWLIDSLFANQSSQQPFK